MNSKVHTEPDPTFSPPPPHNNLWPSLSPARISSRTSDAPIFCHLQMLVIALLSAWPWLPLPPSFHMAYYSALLPPTASVLPHLILTNHTNYVLKLNFFKGKNMPASPALSLWASEAVLDTADSWYLFNKSKKSWTGEMTWEDCLPLFPCPSKPLHPWLLKGRKDLLSPRVTTQTLMPNMNASAIHSTNKDRVKFVQDNQERRVQGTFFFQINPKKWNGFQGSCK